MEQPSEKRNLVKKLSPEARELFFSVEKIEMIETIGKKYSLNKEQTDNMESIINSVILGTEKKGSFPILLEQKLRMEKAKISSLVQEVDEKIFSIISYQPTTKNIDEGREPIGGVDDKKEKESMTTKTFYAMSSDLNQSPHESIPTGPTIEFGKMENLDIDKVLKEIEEPAPAPTTGVAPIGDAYAKAPLPSVKIPDLDIQTSVKKESGGMKNIFEKKLEQFYQAPKKEADGEVSGKTGTAPINLPRERADANHQIGTPSFKTLEPGVFVPKTPTPPPASFAGGTPGAQTQKPWATPKDVFFKKETPKVTQAPPQTQPANAAQQDSYREPLPETIPTKEVIAPNAPSAPAAPTSPTPAPEKPKIDPYRESVE